MTAISNINYYYRHAIESEYVKITVMLVSNVAFKALQSFNYFGWGCALLPATGALPLIALYSINVYAELVLDRWQRRISNRNPSSSLEEQIHRVECITASLLKKSLTFSIEILFPPLELLAKISILPLQGLEKGSEYIEDIFKKMSQKALDTLAIPVQLAISLRHLRTILKEWENHALPQEDRRNASEKIINFYNRSQKLGNRSNRILEIENCKLQDLPDIFHYKPFCNLVGLDLTKNCFMTLPESINTMRQIRQLNLSQNSLSRFPQVIFSFSSNSHVLVDSNQFAEEEVERVVAVINDNDYRGPFISGLSIYEGPQVSDLDRLPNLSLKEIYSVLYRSIDREPKELSSLDKNETIRPWFYRLVDLPHYQKNHKIINEIIIDSLEQADQNERFRTIFTNLIEQALETCGDRVILSILQLDIASQLEKMDLTDVKKLATFLLKGCWVIDLLAECAKNKMKSRPCLDEIEVYLGYPFKLKEELGLPIRQNIMLYFSCSGLTNYNLETAKEYVEDKLNNEDETLNQLITYDKWKKALIYHKGSEMAAIEREKEQGLSAESPDYQAIDNTYNQALKDLSRQILS